VSKPGEKLFGARKRRWEDNIKLDQRNGLVDCSVLMWVSLETIGG